MKYQNVLLLTGLCVMLNACAQTPSPSVPPSAMMITSPAFKSGETIPVKYTCNGEGVSPPLTLSNVPMNTQSLVLIVSDPDAPSGDFVHWVVHGIDPVPLVVNEGAVPSGGSQGITSRGKGGYVPPCPPSGVHRYFFHVYALDLLIQFEVAPTKTELLTTMRGHVLAEAELMGRYGKQ